MLNKVTLENPLRRKLRKAAIVLIVFLIVSIVCLLFCNKVNKTTYNGQTTEVNGILQEVLQDADRLTLKLSDGKLLNANVVADAVDWTTLVGKSICFWMPLSQWGSGEAAIVLGFECDEVTCDPQQNISRKNGELRIMVISFSVTSGVLAVAACALSLWGINIEAQKEFSLAQKYVEFFASNQPHCKLHKVSSIVAFVGAFVCLALIITLTAVSSDAMISVGIALGCALGVFAVATVVLHLVSRRKEIHFYAQNFPFDFTQIHNLLARKRKIAEWEAELRKEREMFPHLFDDGGNGYEAEFSENGVALFEPNAIRFSQFANETPIDVFDSPKQPQPEITFTYEQLNFEAVAFFNVKDFPMFVVVKSRLPDGDYPQQLVNDLHFLLDVNLLKTLQTFVVNVENLNEILENKYALMKEHCLKHGNNR